MVSRLFPPASTTKCLVQSAVRALGVPGSESGGPVRARNYNRSAQENEAPRPKLAHFFFHHGGMVNVSGFESHTVSVLSHSFCHCSAALARPKQCRMHWRRGRGQFHGDFVYKQGRLDLASRLQLARLSKCVVPDSELQGQLEQTPARTGSI